MRTYRFEIRDTLSCDCSLLRPEETLLLEYEAGTDEDAAGNSENDADDLWE